MRHPLFRILSLFIDNLDTNPRIQNKIHTVGFWYWTINFPIITYLFFCQPGLWDKYGLFITLIYSIYANWTSDYTGMSASQGLSSVATEVHTNTDMTTEVLASVQDDLPVISEHQTLHTVETTETNIN